MSFSEFKILMKTFHTAKKLKEIWGIFEEYAKSGIEMTN